VLFYKLRRKNNVETDSSLGSSALHGANNYFDFWSKEEISMGTRGTK